MENLETSSKAGNKKRMYIVSHTETNVGEIIRAKNKEEAIEIAHERGRMEGRLIWKLRKYSCRASKSQEKRFANHEDTAWAR